MRIQRMRLRLQWYDLTVKYRRGKDMELPDTLSRAQLPERKPEIDGLECVSMLSFVSVSYQKYTELKVHKRGAELSPANNSAWLARTQTGSAHSCSAILDSRS